MQVQSLLPAGNTSLANWWNIYDGYNVWRTYGVGDPMPAINNATFAQVQDLANWLEVSCVGGVVVLALLLLLLLPLLLL